MTVKTPAPRASLTPTITRPSREKSEQRGEHLLWLDKNENRDPEYHAFLHKLLANVSDAALWGYPDCHTFYQKLARYLQLEINQLIISTGSDGIIRAVYDAFLAPGDRVMYPNPTFAMYSLYAQMYGAHACPLEYQPSPHGPVLAVETVVSAIKTQRPRVVCIANPGSPTGTVFSLPELEQMITIAEQTGAIILIDEAYYPFHHETVLPWVTKYPHLIVARTFSKAWGLAGIRLGYDAANAEIMSQLHKIRPMYEVGTLSVTLAERALEYPDAMLASVARLNHGKKFFLDAMTALGLHTLPSAGNFLHVAFDRHAAQVHAALAQQVLYRENFAHPSLTGYSRFSATTQQQFLPVIETICQVIEKGRP